MSELILRAVIPFVFKGSSVVWENRKHLGLWYKTKYGKYKDYNIRFSISGLYKIKIPYSNDYLLVFNRKIPNQLQPVGGVYKRKGDDSLFNQWGYKSDVIDNGLDVDMKSDKDLRFMVKGKFCTKVLEWFDEGKERELDPRREFEEELIETGILDREIFRSIDHKHIRRYSKNLRWSDHFQCFEILIYDVFEFLPDDKQKKALIQLATQGSNFKKGYAVVNGSDIERLTYREESQEKARIGQHTKLLINQKF